MKKTNDLSSSESKEIHQRNFRLKVKFPKLKSENEDDSPQPPAELEKKHFCVICNKQFSSGKAYGGHVRIHSMDYKGTKTKQMKMKKKGKSCVVKKEKEEETDLIRADVEGKIRCSLCGQEFQTIHSLFGHMMRHPHRLPSSPEKLKLSYLDDDDEDDDDDTYTDDDDEMSRSMVVSDVTEDVQQAACTLMMIRYSSSNNLAGIKKAMESPKSEVRISSCNGSGKEIEVKVNKPRDEAKRSLGFDLNQPYDEHEDHHPCSSRN